MVEGIWLQPRFSNGTQVRILSYPQNTMRENIQNCQLLLLKNIELRIELMLCSLEISELDKMELCFTYISKIEALRGIVLKEE